jgi:MAC/Perforin domain
MKKIIFFLLSLSCLCSCKDESLIDATSSSGASSTIVINRSSDYPWIPYEQRNLKRLTRTDGLITLRSTLGRSYKIDETQDPMSNVGIDIIDLASFNKDNPGYFSVRRIGAGSTNYFSYTSFSKYDSTSSKTKSVDGGLTLKLGLFSIGAKHKMTSVFTENIVNESNRAFGELNIMIKDSAYILKTTENVINKLTNYLKPIFLEELHMNTPEDFFQSYGGFVITGINTGGMAEALYTGKYDYKYKTSTIEKDMNNSINGSYGFKYKNDSTGGSVSGNLGVGKKYSNTQSSTDKITEIRISVKTLGGSPEYSSFTSPKAIESIDINLNSWLATLSDKSTHTIVDFPDNSLIPMTNFILEKNLKDAFLNFYQNGVSSIKKIQEPKITIKLGYQSGSQCIFETYLNTRYGDKILLNASYQFSETGGDYIKKEIDKWSKILSIKIEAVTWPVEESKNDGYLKEYFAPSNMRKYTAPNGIVYLLYEGTSGKFAYSIYNSTIIDDYAMGNFVNSLPSVEITMDKLKKEYTVYAL